MKAVVIDGFGGVEQLHIQDVDDPPVGRGEVLVRVRATSVNPVDSQRLRRQTDGCRAACDPWPRPRR